MVIKTSFNWLLEWFQILGFRGEKYQRSQHLYPMVSWLVSTDHLDRNINIVFSVKARLFFFSQRWECREEAKGTEGTKGEWQQKLETTKVVVEIAGPQGGWAFDREDRNEEMKVRPALQLEDKSWSFSACKTHSTPAGQFLSWCQSSAVSLQVGTRLLNSNRCCCQEPEAKWILCYKLFQRKSEEQRMLMWLNTYLLTVTTISWL